MVRAGQPLLRAMGVRDIFLLTDSQAAIEEALQCSTDFPDDCGHLQFHFLNRTRFYRDEGGWENQYPSGNGTVEVINILAEFILAQHCSMGIFGQSGFSRMMMHHMCCGFPMSIPGQLPHQCHCPPFVEIKQYLGDILKKTNYSGARHDFHLENNSVSLVFKETSLEYEIDSLGKFTNQEMQQRILLGAKEACLSMCNLNSTLHPSPAVPPACILYLCDISPLSDTLLPKSILQTETTLNSLPLLTRLQSSGRKVSNSGSSVQFGLSGSVVVVCAVALTTVVLLLTLRHGICGLTLFFGLPSIRREFS